MKPFITKYRVVTAYSWLLDSFGKYFGLERKWKEPDEEFKRRILDELVKEETMSRDNSVDKSKESVVNYKSGDKVKIIANSNGHGYEIGDIVTLEIRIYNEDVGKFYWTTRERTTRHRVRECDIEPYSESYSVIINPCNAVEKIEISGTIVYDTVKETNQQSKGDLNMSNTQRRVVNVV